MNIRFAKLEDIETLVDYWRGFHAQSPFGHLALDEVKLAANMRRMIDDKSGAFCFFVADDEAGKAYGVLAGQIDTYYFSNDPIARMIFYWVHPDHRYGAAAVKLMLAFKQWAQNRKAAELMLGVTSGEALALTDRMLKKMGGRLMGGNYSMVLGNDEGQASIPSSAMKRTVT